MTHTQRISYTSHMCEPALLRACIYVYFIEMITQPYLYTLAKERIFSFCVYTSWRFVRLFTGFFFLSLRRNRKYADIESTAAERESGENERGTI